MWSVPNEVKYCLLKQKQKDHVDTTSFLTHVMLRLFFMNKPRNRKQTRLGAYYYFWWTFNEFNVQSFNVVLIVIFYFGLCTMECVILFLCILRTIMYLYFTQILILYSCYCTYLYFNSHGESTYLTWLSHELRTKNSCVRRFQNLFIIGSPRSARSGFQSFIPQKSITIYFSVRNWLSLSLTARLSATSNTWTF